ncbi:acetylornithine deacetylase [Salinarimonas soli]|uniref:Acetylornithine deacetylase n=1 Tax=Salinarimonas soli TaxID=1638099 RepID=A0A5B2VGV7_9HYPH|nr:acetylornithine deacetylase [Salinarimonas soli]KAA2238351.1 acetylornithine deacetylase [Salinarimonas soli]
MDLDRIVSILSTLVAFDTTSRNSNLAIIDWIESYLTPRGFRCERIYDATGTKANLLASIGPEDVPGYVLSGHTDVVPVDDQVWTSDPFVLRADGGRLYGRGACDMKGFLAVCLAAADAMAEKPLAAPLHLAFSYDEEVGCVGARGLVERLAERAVRPQACFVGEPSGMGVVIGHKGKRSVQARVRGLTCHSSLAPEGVNAVHYGALVVAEIQRIADELAESGARDALYDVPFTTGHVGVMRGGTALNIVPDSCEIVFEFRAVGADDPDALVARVVEHARTRLEPRMHAVDPATGIDFETYAGFPGLDTPPDAPVVTLAKTLAARNEHSKVAYGTEAGLFSEIAGIPTVIIGPGSIEQAHKADEWIETAQLETCARFVARIVERARG